jgi:hypothetical protein
VQNLRETIDEGTTVSVDSVRVPGTAGRVSIPEQQITLSGQGLRSARQDVRSATGIPFGSDREQPGGTTERSGVDRGDFDLDELPGTDDSRLARGQNQLQRDFIQGVATTQRRRQRAGEGLPDRSVFSVAPAAPTGVPLLLSSSAATAGGATAGGTGATGGSAAGGATGTGTASSTALEAGSLLATAGAATGLTNRDGEIPVRDRFAEPELEVGEPGAGTEVDVPSGGGRFGESELEAGETGPRPLEVGLGDVFPGAEVPLGERGGDTRATADGRSGTTPDEFPLRDDRVTNILGGRDGSGTLSTSELVRQRPGRQQEDDTVEISEEDIPTDLPAPEETRPSIRERRQRDELLTPERTFPTGESGVVGRQVTTEDTVTEQRDRVEQAEAPLTDGAAGPPGGRLRLDPVLRTDEDVDVRPRVRSRARTRSRTGVRTDTDLDIRPGTDTALDLSLETGQRFTPDNVTRPTTIETGNPPGFETVTEEVTNDFGISPPGSPGPTSEPRLEIDSDEEEDERLPGFGGRDALFSSGFASGEELLEIAVDDTDSS